MTLSVGALALIYGVGMFGGFAFCMAGVEVGIERTSPRMWLGRSLLVAGCLMAIAGAAVFLWGMEYGA
jgi:hypothetical protein